MKYKKRDIDDNRNIYLYLQKVTNKKDGAKYDR